MSPASLLMDHDGDAGFGRAGDLPSVVVVDPQFDNYKPLAASARLGKLVVHFRSSGAEAIKLSRRMRVDAWLVASDLDDMAGQDFIDLLQTRTGGAALAMVETAAAGSARWESTHREAADAGAATTLSPPITFRDLEGLLGLPAEERVGLFAESSQLTRAFVTLPVGVSAAAVAVAVLMLG